VADKVKESLYPQIRTALLPQAYDPAFTNWERKFGGKISADGIPAPRTGPIRTTNLPFAVIANAPAIVISIQNPVRKGLLLKNLDPVTNLYVGFGQLADVNGFFIDPLGYVLLDFTCPTDAISVFATANVRGFMAEMAPIGE